MTLVKSQKNIKNWNFKVYLGMTWSLTWSARLDTSKEDKNWEKQIPEIGPSQYMAWMDGLYLGKLGIVGMPNQDSIGGCDM